MVEGPPKTTNGGPNGGTPDPTYRSNYDPEINIFFIFVFPWDFITPTVIGVSGGEGDALRGERVKL